MKIKVNYISKIYDFTNDEDGYWICPHLRTHHDSNYGGYYYGNGEEANWRDQGAEVCEQCGSYKWDNTDHWENESNDVLGICGYVF